MSEAYQADHSTSTPIVPAELWQISQEIVASHGAPDDCHSGILSFQVKAIENQLLYNLLILSRIAEWHQ
jgi:hypothetical protein